MTLLKNLFKKEVITKPELTVVSSNFKVPLTQIVDIFPHSNAEKLEIAKVYDFQVIVQKDKYKVGDKVIYVPIDSILPKEIESVIFPEGSKITLTKSRVRQIKIRGLTSQGMLIDPVEVGIKNVLLEEDLSLKLKISKYEPPFNVTLDSRPKTLRNKPNENPYLHQYNGINNIKWFLAPFNENEEVVVTEKLHGTNIRFAILPTQANTLYKKILKLLGLLPQYEYCYGSNRVQISAKSNYKGFFNEDIYGSILNKTKAFDKLKPNETVFGEVIGPGIQKNYDYGHKEHHLVIFDVKILNPEDMTQKWLNPEEVELYAKERGFDCVPVLYTGLYNKDLVFNLAKGPSTYCPEQKVTEGVVVKSRYNYNDENFTSSKKSYKIINEEYLADKNNTDFH